MGEGASIGFGGVQSDKEFSKGRNLRFDFPNPPASMSIPTNIAEGCGRNTDAEFARFLQIAMGSASETEYQLLLSHDLGFLTKVQYEKLNNDVTEVKRMLTSFIQTLRADR